MKIIKNNTGFTAIEASIVLALIVIIIVTGFLVYKNQSKSREFTKTQKQTKTSDSVPNLKPFPNKKTFEIKEWNVQAPAEIYAHVDTKPQYVTSFFSYKIEKKKMKDGIFYDSLHLLPIKLDNPKIQECFPVINRYNENSKLEYPDGELSVQNVGDALRERNDKYKYL